MNVRLEEQFGRLLDEAGDSVVPRGSSGASTDPLPAEYERDGHLFAARPDEHTVELRIGAEIAEAARRTPDTTTSDRGDDWIRFAPREWDKHATDRLEAWFRVAWRAAGKGDGRPAQKS